MPSSAESPLKQRRIKIPMLGLFLEKKGEEERRKERKAAFISSSLKCALFQSLPDPIASPAPPDWCSSLLEVQTGPNWTSCLTSSHSASLRVCHGPPAGSGSTLVCPRLLALASSPALSLSFFFFFDILQVSVVMVGGGTGSPVMSPALIILIRISPSLFASVSCISACSDPCSLTSYRHANGSSYSLPGPHGSCPEPWGQVDGVRQEVRDPTRGRVGCFASPDLGGPKLLSGGRSLQVSLLLKRP